MAQDALAEMFVDIKGRIDALKRDLEEAKNESMRKGQVAGQEFGKGFGRGFKKIFAVLGITSLLLGVVNVVKKAIADFRAFEKEMTNVNTILNVSKDQFKEMTAQVKELAAAVGTDAAELAKGLYQAVSAGVEAGQAINFLATAAKAAKAGVSDTETAVDGLTTIINAWHLETKDATKAADIMFKTVERGKTTFGEFSASLSTVAGLAAASGVSFEEIAAATASLTKQGVPTAMAMTQIRAAIIAMNDELGDGWSNMYTLSEAMAEMTRRAGGSNVALKEMVGRVEGVNAILGMTGANARAAADDFEAMQTAGGAMASAFAKHMNTLDKRFSEAANTWQNIFLKAVEFGKKVIIGATIAVKKFGEAIGFESESLKTSSRTIIAGLEEQGAAVGLLDKAYSAFFTELGKKWIDVYKESQVYFKGLKYGEDLHSAINQLMAKQVERVQEIQKLQADMVNKSKEQREEIQKAVDEHQRHIDYYQAAIDKAKELLAIEAEQAAIQQKRLALRQQETLAQETQAGVQKPPLPEIPVDYADDFRRELEDALRPEIPEIPLEETEDELSEYVTNIQDKMATVKSITKAAADSLLSGGLMTVWRSMTQEMRKESNVAVQIITSMVDSILAELARIAAFKLITSLFPGGGVTGILGQHGLHGYGGFAERRMQSGGSLDVPFGFQNDKYPILVDTGEHVDVTSRGRVSMQEALLSSLINRVEALNMNLIEGNIGSRPGKQQIEVGGRIHGKDILLTYNKSNRYKERSG